MEKMNYDDYGEVINGEDTYRSIADLIKHGSNAVMVGWTDQKGTHFDILFKSGAMVFGTNIQGGVRWDDLFVSIMRWGAFGFEIAHNTTSAGYYDEKMGGKMGEETARAFAELVNGVKKYL